MMEASERGGRRIGLYGGTFAPPHAGHVHAARAFSRAIQPDIFYILPAFTPPHKLIDPSDSPFDRLEMARRAFGGIPQAIVSDYEIREGGRSYTVNTLRHLWSEGDIYMLVGTDMFLSLPAWREPEEVFRLAHIVLMRRESDPNETSLIKQAHERYVREFSARITQIDERALELSSTELRERLAGGRPIDGLVPSDVEDYIREHGLYGYGANAASEK